MNVYLIDDQKIILEGLRRIIECDHEITIIGESTDPFEAISDIMTKDVDVVLVDIRMPRMNGLQVTKRIKKEKPEIKVVILTTFKEKDYLIEGIKNGIDGYLLKDGEIDDILQSIRDVYNNKKVFDKETVPIMAEVISDNLLQKEECSEQLKSLSPREREVVSLILKGFSNREIGQRLFLSEGTVKNMVSAILEKCNLKRRTQLFQLKR